MKKETKRKIVIFLLGLMLVSFLTAAGSLAFLSQDLLGVIRNVFITDTTFVILYVVWIKLHKGYETIYRSGLKFEEEK